MKILAPILLAVSFTVGILFLSSHSYKIGVSISENTYLNFQINYQMMLLGIAIISMITSYFLNPESFKSILSIGNISAPGRN